MGVGAAALGRMGAAAGEGAAEMGAAAPRLGRLMEAVAGAVAGAEELGAGAAAGAGGAARAGAGAGAGEGAAEMGAGAGATQAEKVTVTVLIQTQFQSQGRQQAAMAQNPQILNQNLNQKDQSILIDGSGLTRCLRHISADYR